MNSNLNNDDNKLTFERINYMFNVVCSDDKDYMIADKLYNLYPSSTSLAVAYRLFMVDLPLKTSMYAIMDSKGMIDHVNKTYLEFERRGIMSNIDYFYKNKTYFETLSYARFIVSSYIAYLKNKNSFDFFSYYGIDNDVFNYCLNNIEELDVNLYNEFLDMIKHSNNDCDKSTNIQVTKNVINDLYNGITTGLLSDGTEFNLLEFIKRVPFKNLESKFFYTIVNFMKSYNKKEMGTIIKYINDNRIYAPSFFVPLSIKQVYQTKIVIKDKELTNDDKDVIFNYLQLNDIPVINKTYFLVRDKYLNGDISSEDIEKQKKKDCLKRILIP